jgi:hypothetical protein
MVTLERQGKLVTVGHRWPDGFCQVSRQSGVCEHLTAADVV